MLCYVCDHQASIYHEWGAVAVADWPRAPMHNSHRNGHCRTDFSLSLFLLAHCLQATTLRTELAFSIDSTWRLNSLPHCQALSHPSGQASHLAANVCVCAVQSLAKCVLACENVVAHYRLGGMCFGAAALGHSLHTSLTLMQLVALLVAAAL